MLTCSTSVVTSPRISITAADTSRYAAMSGATTTACGHMRRAIASGIAEWTPKARAS